LADLTTRAGENGLRTIAATGSEFDNEILADPSTAVWPAGRSTQHHWATVAALIARVQRLPGLVARIEESERMLNDAARRWQALKTAGFMMNGQTAGAHVQVWQDALRGLRAEVQI